MRTFQVFRIESRPSGRFPDMALGQKQTSGRLVSLLPAECFEPCVHVVYCPPVFGSNALCAASGASNLLL